LKNVLIEFRDRLLGITENVYHFEASQASALPYIIWQETGGRALYGENVDAERVHSVQLDIYSETEFDPLIEDVLNMMREADIAFEFPITDYEKDLKLIRTIIECEVI
jgi:hypothetical protein